MTKGQTGSFVNYQDAQKCRDKASEKAREELSARGIHYPVKLPGMSVIEFHDAMIAYGEQETALILKYMKPTPRPLAIDNVEPPKKQQWGRPYYD